MEYRGSEAKIGKLESVIDEYTQELGATTEEITSVTDYMNAAKAQRETENGEFLALKADDQSAIGLLESAKESLSVYYKNNSIELGLIQGSVKGAYLLQQDSKKDPEFRISEDQAPDATFGDK